MNTGGTTSAGKWSKTRCSHYYPKQQSWSKVTENYLRTVPTIVTNCAYVLRIARYSSFLWVVPTNTGIFLRGLKLYGESRPYQMLLVSQKKIGGNHVFFRDN